MTIVWAGARNPGLRSETWGIRILRQLDLSFWCGGGVGSIHIRRQQLKQKIPPLPLRLVALAQGLGRDDARHGRGTTGPLLLGGSVGLNLRARSGVETTSAAGGLSAFLTSTPKT